MKKVFGQTVRDLKREVNKKVLKVPGIEQKVLDATSNEPWGPHGSLLADIAQATRNYHEYQMIMVVLWKRLNDTGKNWRHVYKALTVLEYLVANGSERVIDDIKEHAYQLSTLSNFQYIDSSGRDQGNNVRRKSQSLVALVNDKERIIEVRQKAAANRDKFRSISSGGMYRPGSYPSGGGYDDDRYNSRYGRDEDRYGREREWGDEKYGRSGDSYGRDDDRYSRDSYRDEGYQGRPRSVDDYQYGSRSRSSDRERSYDDDGQYSSRGSGARAEDSSLNGGQLERKFSEQNLDGKLSEQNHGAPPSYEEVVGESRSPVHNERDGDTSNASVHRSPSPVNNNTAQDTTAAVGQKNEAPDEFDPRGPVAASPTASTDAVLSTTNHAAPTSNSFEFDLLGSLSDSFSSNAMAAVPPTSAIASEADTYANSGAGSTFVTQTTSDFGNQSFEDPFGESPFKAIPSNDVVSPQANPSASGASFQSMPNQNSEPVHTGALQVGTASNVDSGDSLLALTYPASSVAPASLDSQLPQQEFSTPDNSTDILAGILPPSGASAVESQDSFSAPTVGATYPGANIFGSVQQMGHPAPAAPNMVPQGQPGLTQLASSGGFPSQGGSIAPVSSQMGAQFPAGPTSQFGGNFLNQPASTAPAMFTSPFAQPPGGPDVQFSSGNFLSQTGAAAAAPVTSQMATQPPGVPHAQYQNASLLSQQASAGSAPTTSQVAPHPSFGATAQNNTGNFLPQQGLPAPVSQMPSQTPTGLGPQQASAAQAPITSQMAPHTSFGAGAQNNSGNFLPQQGLATPVSQMSSQTPTGQSPHGSNNGLGNLLLQSGPSTTIASQPNPSNSVGAPVTTQPSKDKFETKSAIWSDTLSRGLVNLNISGPKINPLADIGIDFDALNRREKRMEKPAMTAVTSTVTMGKAMGSGSGIGRAGASALRASSNPTMNPGMGMGLGMGMGGGPTGGMGMGMGGGPTGGMGMGMGGGPGAGIGMASGYGTMNQPMGNNMSMGMGRGMNLGMGMGMGVGPGPQMQRPTAMPPGPGMNTSGSYNPMMGSGYTQNPYGASYR